MHVIYVLQTSWCMVGLSPHDHHDNTGGGGQYLENKPQTRGILHDPDADTRYSIIVGLHQRRIQKIRNEGGGGSAPPKSAPVGYMTFGYIKALV